MKVLQINKHAWPHYGGIEKIVEDIVEYSPNNVTVDVLCISDSATDAELEGDSFGDDQILVASNIYKAKSGIKLLGMPISLDFFRKAKVLIPNYDLIILHHPFPLGFLVYWLYGQEQPMVVWYHSDVIRQKISGFIIRPLFKKILGLAKFVIVAHQSIAANSKLLEFYAEKVIVIPFLAKSVKEEVTRQVESKNQIQLLSVGRLVYYKGYEYLLKAMVGVPAKLTIIGRGPYLPKLQSLITDLNLQNVQIIDPVSDLSGYYSSCDIFILPSVEKSEAFGLVQLEAMSYGKFVFITGLP